MDEKIFINRHSTNTINKLKKIFKVIMLTGPRQSGKSTLLRHYKPDLQYLNFDSNVLQNLLKNDEETFFKTYKLPLIFDEVQRVPNLFLSLKNEIDKVDKKEQAYLSGSQSLKLMKFVSESLAGRVGIIYQLPLSQREMLKVEISDAFLPTKEYAEKREKISELFNYDEIWNNILRGGLPELFVSKDIDKELYFTSYINTYLERDVRDLAQVGDLLRFNNFMVALASISGDLLNIESLSRDLKINRATCERYISILEASHMIYILKPYSNNILNRVVKTPKVYFTDTGIMAYLLGWKDATTLKNGPMAGKFLENYVVSEILKSYYNNGTLEPKMYFYRDKDKKEIDLIMEENGTLYPIEIKKHSSPDKNDVKSFAILNKIPNIKIGEGAVICFYDKVILLKENVRSIPVSYI